MKLLIPQIPNWKDPTLQGICAYVNTLSRNNLISGLLSMTNGFVKLFLRVFLLSGIKLATIIEIDIIASSLSKYLIKSKF